MDGKPYCRNKAASSNSSGIDWKRLQRNNAVMGSLIIRCNFFEIARMPGNFAYTDNNMEIIGVIIRMRRKLFA